MAKLEVRRYPDPVLMRKSAPVEKFDRALKLFVDDMFETMYLSKGVGLAAPQVGVNTRIFVVNCEWEEKGADAEIALINPEIIEAREPYTSEEGCLSFPGIYAEVERSHHVKVRYRDVEGNVKELEADGLLARALQHELDHLDGKVFIDYLKPEQLVLVEKDVEQLRREFKRKLRA
jgi:peptide deformylase